MGHNDATQSNRGVRDDNMSCRPCHLVDDPIQCGKFKGVSYCVDNEEDRSGGFDEFKVVA